MEEASRVKVCVRFETGTPGEYEVESMWAIPTPDGYQLDNIPMYALSLALGDVVRASPDEDGMLLYDALQRASGHSTVRVWVADEQRAKELRDVFRALGCASELSEQPRLFAIDIPPDVPYAKVKAVLDSHQAADALDYEEACLADLP